MPRALDGSALVPTFPGTGTGPVLVTDDGTVTAPLTALTPDGYHRAVKGADQAYISAEAERLHLGPDVLGGTQAIGCGFGGRAGETERRHPNFSLE